MTHIPATLGPVSSSNFGANEIPARFHLTSDQAKTILRNSGQELKDFIVEHYGQPPISLLTSPTSNNSVWGEHLMNFCKAYGNAVFNVNHGGDIYMAKGLRHLEGKDTQNILSLRVGFQDGKISEIKVPKLPDQLNNREPLSKLSLETMQTIGANLGDKHLAALSRTSKLYHQIFKSQLALRQIMASVGAKVTHSDGVHLNWNLLETLAFAGKQMVRDENGHTVVGEDGIPKLEYPAVLDANKEPLRYPNGEIIRRNPILSDHYFSTPPSKMPAVLGPQDVPLHDKDGNIVREMPTLNHHYFGTALLALETAYLTDTFRQASLNTLSDVIRANPLPEYKPGIDLRHNPSGKLESVQVTFPEPLKKALQSNSSLVRSWAAQRVDDVLHTYEDKAEIRIDERFRIEDAILDAWLSMENYGATSVTKLNRQRRTVNTIHYGNFHKDLFLSPELRIRNLAEKLARYVAAKNNLRNKLKEIERENKIYAFSSKTIDGKTTRKIPNGFDAWLLPQRRYDQQINMRTLIGLIYNTSGSCGSAARGIANYLVKNIAHWPVDHIQAFLLSDLVLLTNNQTLSIDREIFVATLRESQRLPDDIVGQVDKWLHTAEKNKSLEARYNQDCYRHVSSVSLLKDWATRQNIDLTELAQSTREKFDNTVEEFVAQTGNSSAKDLREFVNWLFNTSGPRSGTSSNSRPQGRTFEFDWSDSYQHSYPKSTPNSNQGAPMSRWSAAQLDVFTRVGVSPSATQGEILKRKRELSLLWHPDKAKIRNVSVEEANEKIKQINDDIDKLLQWTGNN